MAIPKDLVAASATPLILSILTRGESYGYAIIKRVAELTDGKRIFGERAIDMPRGTQREKIRDVYLVPHHSDTISVYPPVLDAIKSADYIILGPGDLFTSIIPNLIVPGLTEAICHSFATLFFVINIYFSKLNGSL